MKAISIKKGNHIVMGALLFFIWVQRREIFSSVKSSRLPGAIACMAGLTFYAMGYVLRDQLSNPAFRNQDVSNDYLSLFIPVVYLLRKGEMKNSASKQETGANGRCKCQSVS